jgi:hypothetical protein
MHHHMTPQQAGNPRSLPSPFRALGLGGDVWTGGYTEAASAGTATWPNPAGPLDPVPVGYGTTADPHPRPDAHIRRTGKWTLIVGAVSLHALFLIWLGLPS